MTPTRRLLRLTGLLWIVCGAAGGAQGVAPAVDDVDVVTAPVTLDGAVLFRVRGVSSYPAEERARVISERIAAAAADRSLPVASLHTVPLDNAVRIDAGARPLLAVVDADGALEGLSRAELAAAHVIQLKQAIAEYRDARTPEARRRSAVRSAIAAILFIALILLMRRLWRWLDRLMEQRVQARIHSVGIQSFEVMRAERIRAALDSTILGVRIVLGVAAVFAFVGYVLAQWPSTRTLARGTAGLALDPLRTLGAGLVANIPRFAFLAVLFVMVRSLLRLLHMFFDAVDRGTVTLRKFEPEWAQPTYKIVRFATVAFSLIVAYPYIPGSESEAFKGVTLFVGVLFSLGSSTALSNVIAGYMMTYRRALRVGDLVRIGDATGVVIELRLQATHLRNYRNAEIVIPNSEILTSDVVNYSALGKVQPLMASTEVAIGYGTAWQHVEGMLLDAAARTPGLAAEPKPRVLVRKLAEFAVTYELIAPCAEARTMLTTSSALNRSVLDVFNEHGVQIMVPAYEADPPEPKLANASPSPRETAAPRSPMV